MARRGNNSNKSKGRSNTNGKVTRNNFQDEAEIKEFNKGYKAGRNSKNNNKKGHYASNLKEPVSIKTGEKENDPSWYTPNPQLLKDAASISLNAKTGYPIYTQPGGFTSLGQYNLGTTFVPGVLTLFTVPTFGDPDDSNDPINVAAASFFSSLRRATSGTSYYEKGDSLLYLIGVGQLYSLYSYMTRAYGTISEYSFDNTYTPNVLLRAMGINASDFRRNQSNFRLWLNDFALRLQTLPMPNVLSYTTRQIFLYEGIYLDSNTSKAQYLMYNPMGFYKYSEGTETSAAGTLTFTSLPGTAQTTLMTTESLMNYAESLMQPILNSQDMSQYIVSDILKAYSPSSMFMVSPIAENFRVQAHYNQEILMQMENCYIYNFTSFESTLGQNMTINTDQSLIWNYKVSPTLNTGGISNDELADAYKSLQQFIKDDEILVNFHKDNITPEDFMVASRLSGAPLQLDATGAYRFKTVGSEVVAFGMLSVYTSPNMTDSGLIQYPLTTDNFFTFNKTLDDTGVMTSFIVAQILSSFDWHPGIRYTVFTGISSGSPSITLCTGKMMDLETTATLSVTDLKNMNRVAMLGEFDSKIANSINIK